MAFIIALGIIIILLCSASIFTLFQPKIEHYTKRNAMKKLRREPVSEKKSQKKSEHMSPSKLEKQPIVMSEPTAPAAPAPAPAQIAPAIQAHVAAVQRKIKLPEMIILHLAAESGRPYVGYEFLQALLSAGMRFGKMDFFHRHEKKTGLGAILFSLAACTQEGTFDLSTISSFSCEGVILFMKPREVTDPAKVFQLMLETADQLITTLGGQVLNSQQQLLRKEEVIQIHHQLQCAA